MNSPEKGIIHTGENIDPEGTKTTGTRWDHLTRVSDIIEGRNFLVKKGDAPKVPGIKREIIGFKGKKKLPSIGQFLHVLTFLESRQHGFTQKQYDIFYKLLKKKYTYSESENGFLKGTWMKCRDILNFAPNNNVEEFAGYIYLEHNPSRLDKAHEHASSISNEQIIGNGDPIMVGGRGFRTLSYYIRLYPEIDPVLLERQFGYVKKEINIFHSNGNLLGRLVVIPDGIIKSDNPSNYYDIFPRFQGLGGSDAYVRYYSAQGINMKYAEEYDVFKFLVDASAIRLHKSGELYYNGIEIERTINNDVSFYSLDAAETAGVDLLGGKKVVFWGKVYIRADWKRFTDNPYVLAYAQKHVVNFSEVKKAELQEMVEKLEGELRISTAQMNLLALPGETRRNNMRSIRGRINTLKSYLKKEIPVVEEVKARQSLTQYEIELAEATRNDRTLSEKENGPLLDARRKVSNLQEEIERYRKGTKQIPGNEHYISHRGNLYVEEGFLEESLKGFKNPVDLHTVYEDSTSEIRYFDGELYTANPSKAFAGISIDWESFLKHISRHSFGEGASDAYKYKDIAKALILARFAYQDGINRGVIIHNDAQWINLSSRDAINDLADSFHKGHESTRLLIADSMEEIDAVAPSIQMYDFDSGMMKKLYEKNAVTSFLDTTKKSRKMKSYKGLVS